MITLHKTLSWEETFELLKRLGPPPAAVKSVYGPGKSGGTLAEMFAAIHGLEVRDYPHEADMFLDDTVFTGRTYFRLREAFPDKPFWALVWHSKRVHPRRRRDAQGKPVTETITRRGKEVQRIKVTRGFQLGPRDKGVLIDPRHRVFFPMKQLGLRKADGALLAARLMEKSKASGRMDKGRERKWFTVNSGFALKVPFPKPLLRSLRPFAAIFRFHERSADFRGKAVNSEQ